MKKIFTLLIIAIILVLSLGFASAYYYGDYEYKEDYRYVTTKTHYLDGYNKIIKTYYSEPFEIKDRIIYYESPPYQNSYLRYRDYDFSYPDYYKYHEKPSYYYKYNHYLREYEIHECYHYPPAGQLFYRKCP